jgi:branched-chain amino acid transport system ATP-binding protein
MARPSFEKAPQCALSRDEVAAMDVTPKPSSPSLLTLDDVEVVYDGIIVGLRGVTLEVPKGTIVALLGPNGAGKSTTLKAASGLLAAERGEIRRGTVAFRGQPVRVPIPSKLAREGFVQVLEGRHCFAHLTVEENLATGAYARRPSRLELREALDHIYERFPRLRDRRHVAAGHLSGGEQQMVAIGRALIGRPTLILLDEPSMGLAPKVVEEVFALVRELHARDGVSFLLAEQNAAGALAVADTAYVLENGRVVASGSAAAIRARDDVQELYLGRGAGGRVRFRNRKEIAVSEAAR